MTNEASKPFDDDAAPDAIMRPQSRQVWRQLVAYAGRGRQRGWLLAIGGIFVGSLAVAMVIRQTHPLLDAADKAILDPTGRQAAVERIVFLLGSMIVLTLLGELLRGYGRALIAKLAQHMLVDIRTDFYASLLRQNPAFYRKNEVGKLVATGMSDNEVVGAFFTQQAPYLLVNLGQFILALAFMLAFNWQLALASVVLVTLFHGLSLRVVVPRTQRLADQYREQFASVNAEMNEHLAGVRDIQMFTQEARSRARFRAQLVKLAGYMTRNMRLTVTNVAIFYMLSGLGLALIYGAGSLGIIQGFLDMTIGQLVAFAGFFAQFISPITAFSGALVSLQSTIVAAQRVFGIMEAEPAIQDKLDAVDPGILTGHIKFENVSFSYNPDDPMDWRLANVELEIQPGEKVAFVGGSGSGKSTLLNLVVRLFDATEGRVTIDGYDVRDLKLDALRRNIGLVAQSVVLFQGTVADNIRFAQPDADMEAVQQAAEVGHVTDFIGQLDDGYDTMLGELGQGLSGGQRQRVSIARAALADRPIMILDEATSALDSQSELAVTKALDRLTRGRTTLVIAHRLNTVKNADKIVVLGMNDSGQAVVKAVGQHDELLEQSDEYAALYSEKAQYKSILMPIGPLYNTTPVMPVVVGMARTYKAPVYVLDFGLIKREQVSSVSYGVEIGHAFTGEDLTEVNRAHIQRVEGVIGTFRHEGIQAEVLEAADGMTWIEATIDALDRTEASHMVAMENIFVPLEELRLAIRTIERKTQIDYILVDPTVGGQDLQIARKFKLETDWSTRDTVIPTSAAISQRLKEISGPVPTSQIKQFNPLMMIGMFVWPATWYLGLFLALFPMLRDRLGWPAPAAFLVVAALGSAAELAVGLWLTRREGHTRGLKGRLALFWPQKSGEWLLFVVVAVVVLVAPLLLAPVDTQLLAPIFPTPPEWPNVVELPMWALLVMALVVGPLLTVFGEEVYYRGYLLPKMRGVCGSAAWIVNAVFYILKQIHQPWIAYRLGNLVGALGFAYFGQRRQVWASVALHYLSSVVILLLLTIP